MLRHVPPAEVMACWGFVEHGLQRIQKRCRYTNWQIHEVLARLLAGTVGLFICEDGFVVLEVDHEAVSRRPFLNVWLSWFKPGRAKALRKPLVAWLDEMTTLHKCEWHQFSSPRFGWKGAHEYEVHMITWRRKR